MSSASNLIILLDLIEAGMKINQRIADGLRKAEMEGRNITKEELKQLADENDALFDEVVKELS